MSYVKTTIQFPDISHGFTEEEARKLTVEEFDELPLSDQMHLFNNHRSVYDRLTGKSNDDTALQNAPEPTPEDREKQFADKFERVVDNAIHRAFHPNEP